MPKTTYIIRKRKEPETLGPQRSHHQEYQSFLFPTNKCKNIINSLYCAYLQFAGNLRLLMVGGNKISLVGFQDHETNKQNKIQKK